MSDTSAKKELSPEENLSIGKQLMVARSYAEAVPFLEEVKKYAQKPHQIFLKKSACLHLAVCYLAGDDDKLYRNLKKAKENFEFCDASQSGYNKLKNAIKEADERLNELIPDYMQFKEIKQRCLEAKETLMSPLLVSFLSEQKLVQLVELADKLPNIETQLMTLSMEVFKIQPDHYIIKEFLKNGGDLGLLCNPNAYTKQYSEVLIEVGTEECKKILIDNTAAILLDSGKNLTELLKDFDGSLEKLLPFNLYTIVKNNEGIYNGILEQLTQKLGEQNHEPKEESESKFADVAAAAPATSSSTSAAAIAAAAAPSTPDSSDISDGDLSRTASLLYSFVTLNKDKFGLDKSTSARIHPKNYDGWCVANAQQKEQREKGTKEVYDYLLNHLNEIMQAYKSKKRPDTTVLKVINKILEEDGTLKDEDLLGQLGVKITDLMPKQQEKGRSK